MKWEKVVNYMETGVHIGHYKASVTFLWLAGNEGMQTNMESRHSRMVSENGSWGMKA